MDMVKKGVPAAVVAGVVLLGLLGAAPAFAEMPWWQLSSSSAPGSLPPGGEGKIIVIATNVGDAATNGSTSPLVLSDTLPPGLKATAITGREGLQNKEVALTCSLSSLSCQLESSKPVPPFQAIEVTITVKVEGGAHSGEENRATVSGAGAPSAATSQQLTVGTATPFGGARY